MFCWSSLRVWLHDFLATQRKEGSWLCFLVLLREYYISLALLASWGLAWYGTSIADLSLFSENRDANGIMQTNIISCEKQYEAARSDARLCGRLVLLGLIALTKMWQGIAPEGPEVCSNLTKWLSCTPAVGGALVCSAAFG
ncbi:hypothetical protein Nepgr_011575 [Nepenthes gracilis]|uniref:Uncharacterized protein n=1 Tax=Nepenthes gracilis TaxID=150966 RepID=A0AAD3XMF4_NEPGR|nr:hypothetical protein Nepgr_011575 [Nepenthes gracilis]